MKLISWVLLHEYFQGAGINRGTGSPGRGGMPHSGPYGEALPQRGAFFKLAVY